MLIICQQEQHLPKYATLQMSRTYTTTHASRLFLKVRGLNFARQFIIPLECLFLTEVMNSLAETAINRCSSFGSSRRFYGKNAMDEHRTNSISGLICIIIIIILIKLYFVIKKKDII